MATTWDSGYVSDIGYTYGYYADLNPGRVSLALLHSGVKPAPIRTACELGYGQGMSINIHNAAGIAAWYGTDFNPHQAAFARSLEASYSKDTHLFDDSFDAFAARTDLPTFDYIALHGIWSWVSESNRAVIQKFIADNLAVGGVLYISYNTYPGWSGFSPIRHLMRHHTEVVGSAGEGLISSIDSAIDFADRLLSVEPAYAKLIPTLRQRVDQLASHHKHYLAHEYFNKDWHPIYFSAMAETLQDAKLSYAGTANYLDNLLAIHMNAEQQEFFKQIKHPILRESVRDIICNTSFRRDLWVKGAISLTPLERVEQLRKIKIAPIATKDVVPKSLSGVLGEATLTPEVYDPVVDAALGSKIKAIHELEAEVAEKGVNFEQLMEAILVLAAKGCVAVAQEEAAVDECIYSTEALNLQLFNRARSNADIRWVASPVTGGGIFLDRFDQMFAASAKYGKKDPEDWAMDVWEVLESQGQRIVKDGEQLATEAENLQHLQEQVAVFMDNKKPTLQQLKVI